MATITVTNTDDSGAGSLRQAIADAIAGDTIVFDASLAGQSITLTSGQLALTKDITINGDIDGDRKADITISGNDASRIFDIAGAITGTEVELRSLTLKQGNAGGGFGGAVTVAGTTILKVIDSTISDSAAVSGGGIAAFGPLTVVNSTITGNTATSTGGGVMRTGGDVTFVNSTIHDNHSDLGGGIFVAASLLTILNSTVSGNTATSGGAGFHGIASSDAVIRNSVVAENAGPNGDLSISGSVHAGSSFFGATAHTIVDHGGNIVNGGDPLLGDLADNGGPVQTRAILAGSPLIGAGNAALLPDDAFDLDGDADTSEDLPLDARGHTRVLDANLDIGATEFDTAPVLSGVTSPVTFSENTVNAAPQLLDADVTFTDNDDNFDGGALTVTGLLVEDVVSIRNQGNGLGQIGLSAGVVSFSGTDIGVATGGNGTALTVTFNTDATAAAIEALIENLTYANSSGTPTASRTLTVTVTEADGDVTRDLSQPAFAEATGAANPFDGVDVGFDSTPILADLDGDGDLDAIIGENVGNLNYFRNTGTANAPVFVQQTGAANPFDGIDVGSVSTPALADLDGDGALDMVVGEAFGTLLYFQNTGTAAAPVFVAQTGTAHPFDGIDVGFFSSPTLADLDGDGDLDAVVGSADVGPEVIGEKFGTLHYFQNTGTAAAPVFVEQTGAANPFDGMNAVDRPAPDLADLDGDGDFDAVVAEYLSGTLFYLQNIGTAAAPVFVERTGAANPFDGID
ncbi:MAG: choice-of-anchor Q domain-containing protein, partial [Pseudorhodoplanes sp.]